MTGTTTGDARGATTARRPEPPHEHGPRAIAEYLHRQTDPYSDDDEDRPLASYAGISVAYAALVGGAALVARRRGARAPERIAWGDVALMTVATAKFSRLLAKDPVTSPLRAPFTRFQGRGGEAELSEETRGTGARHAIGELVTCPFCLGQWVATAFAAGVAIAPRPTRLAALTGTLIAGADTLQYGFAGLQRLWEQKSGGS